MAIEKVAVKTKRAESAYEIRIGEGLLKNSGKWALECGAAKGSKAAIISNRKVFSLYGEAVSKSLSSAGFNVSVYLIGDGERFKNFATLQKVLDFLGKER